MKVLVVGGSGFIGSHLCRELQSRGHSVTAMSRSPNSEDLPDGVEKAMGDVTDYDSIAGAFEGKDAVVNLVALSPLFEPKGGNRMHDIVHWQGTENVVKAAEANDVSRLVQMSALGADTDGDTAYIRSKGKAEQAVKSSGLDWVIFRPSVVFGDGGEFVSFTKRLKGMFAPGVPLYPLPGNGKTRFQPIWVGDLVPMLADGVEDDDRVGETYRIGGPEKLTLREITEMVYDAENKSITIVPLPMGLAGVGLTVLGAVPGFPMGKDQYRSLQFDNTTDQNDVGVFGVDTSSMKTLGAYLAERN
ncbi:MULTISPECIES: complex I NDUFA9 subunit family protein [Haloferax]|uniref:ArNOG06768 family NADH-binding domain protein n=2 Tax=Haloferax gibbonsii TaxID=35746 RepID=A0A0K1IUN5_HALGI|nr:MULTISPECIES: complex I NDUFA9 subunit family protein [Haloferax]AKU08237.1 NADH dehydrogenase [Haloferax gibbonsii]ELZ79809.1 NADH dehydrogenase/oxidoreductase-like protein [Haloferax gibbonsii ATCC 33959]QOS12595.1 arNOG06768 family NADH-binding domain protein [Haloferax gibbonsii]RDZ52600.1 complex I NDUFA9 subunit family protein [Haloferax sp. Atlit-4N]REA03774.1 complex I NDUFA9 subunit family protein [Haloferax sp. Atlit-6N]